MKFQNHIFLFFVVLFLTLNTSQAQSIPSCCQASSIKAFTDLANDLSFVITHEEPFPFVLQNPSGKDITYSISGENDGKGYYITGKKDNHQWIFVFQEWWGLNDYIRQECEKLHTAFPNAHVLAVDLYDGKVATTREEAGAFMQSAKPERIEKIINGASVFAGPKSKIATIGWCFGGGWSNKTAVLLGDQVVACIMYYGMPVTDENQINQIKAPVLGLFANNDNWITPKVVSDFKDAMIKNGKTVEVYGYDADHAFANPSNPKFNEAFTADAWKKTVAFITKYL